MIVNGHWEFFCHDAEYVHCVVTEKVPTRYSSLKMADSSLGKCSIFVD